MAWLGIPFPLPTEILNSTILSIGKIPKIIVDSGFGWDNLAGSLIAGVIPAFIAWYSIRKNLKELERDRLLQQASFDRDRDAQLNIASKNLNAQVLSVNRQQWINSLRDTTANYMSAVNALRKSRTMARYCLQLAKKNDHDFFIQYGGQISAMTEDAREVDNLSFKIRLLLNPAEEEAIKITSLLKDITFNTGAFERRPDKNAIASLGDELVEVTQKYIKKEWDKVKRAE